MFNAGDDVWVEWMGLEHPGEVLKVENHGWVRCEILTDPLWDYGSGGARVAPHQTVAVKSGRVRERVREDSPGVLAAREGGALQ